MKILVVCSYTTGKISPFIEEQNASLRKKNIAIDYLLIKKSGPFGYLDAYFSLLKKLYRSDYDLVHAHYGLSGFISVFQFFKPVIVTFHGSDVNEHSTKWISRVAYQLSDYSIFVEEAIKNKLRAHKKAMVLPCGIDLDVFKPLNKEAARATLGWDQNARIALFSSSFDTPIKNAPLAIAACEQIAGLELRELKNFSRQQINLMLNACDFLILTSINEGSPQIIKEALATNCPVVSVDAGDIKQRLDGVENCYISDYSTDQIVEKIKAVLKSNARANGSGKVVSLELGVIATELVKIYKETIK